MTAWYRQGTVSIEADSTAVTGELTGWLNQVTAGDAITFDGGQRWYEISEDPENNTELTLGSAYSGPLIDGGEYAIRRYNPKWPLASSLATQLDELISGQSDVYRGYGAPASTLGNEDALYIDVINKLLYGPKASGSWGVGLPLIAGDNGFRYTWSTNTGNSDPGSGKVKVSNVS